MGENWKYNNSFSNEVNAFFANSGSSNTPAPSKNNVQNTPSSNPGNIPFEHFDFSEDRNSGNNSVNNNANNRTVNNVTNSSSSGTGSTSNSGWKNNSNYSDAVNAFFSGASKPAATNSPASNQNQGYNNNQNVSQRPANQGTTGVRPSNQAPANQSAPESKKPASDWKPNSNFSDEINAFFGGRAASAGSSSNNASSNNSGNRNQPQSTNNSGGYNSNSQFMFGNAANNVRQGSTPVRPANSQSTGFGQNPFQSINQNMSSNNATYNGAYNPNNNSGQRPEKSYEEIASLAKSVVMIAIHDKDGDIVGTGSGIMIGYNGYILTNKHVVSAGRSYTVRIEGENKDYRTDTVIKVHGIYDLAIIRINKPLNPLPIYRGKPLQRGQKVVAIGSPLGLFNSVSDGIISGFRNVDNCDMIQFTAPISHGSSGGALLNMQGEVIGISTAGIDKGQNLNLAVSYEAIINFAGGFIGK